MEAKVPKKKKSVRKDLIKAAGIVGLMTLASRILGLIRDIVSAKQFGTTWQWDAFVYAFMLPNFLRRIVGEGALSSAFIPVYSEIHEQKGKESAFRFANTVTTLLTGGILLLTLFLEIVFHFFLKAGFLPVRVAFTTDLLRFLFPYLWFMMLYAIGMGVLNCHQRFWASSIGPVILDIVWIIGVIWITPRAGKIPENQLRFLSAAILFSGLLQWAAQVPSLRQMGYQARWVWDTVNASVRKTWKLLLPGLMNFAIVQINVLVDMTCGLAIGGGANSSLWYGTRLMQFPLAIFAVAMETALLPTVSAQAAHKDHEEIRKTLSFALRSVFLIILPCTVGLIFLRVPIVQLLFQRGQFNAVSTLRTARVLLYYSIGLFAYSGQKIMAAGFYAGQDTRTPVRAGAAALLTNIVLNLILMNFMKEAGLALATSLAGILQFSLLSFFYHRKTGNFPFREIAGSFFRILMASLAMGFAGSRCYFFLARYAGSDHLVPLAIRVLGTILISSAAYGAFCFLFRVHEIREAWDWMKKRKKIQTPEELLAAESSGADLG